jgi:hypothetical protein
MFYKYLLVFVGVGLLRTVCFPSEIKSQNWNSLLKYLGDKDKETIEKAISSLKNAGELTKLANEYYNNALELQSNFDLEEETLQKKLSKEESRAISTQMKADKIYTEANKSVLEICKKKLENQGSDKSKTAGFEKKADDLVNQALQKRNESKSIKNVYEKATVLNEASGYEAEAIENLISALMISNGDSTDLEPEQTNQEVEQLVQNEILVLTHDSLELSANKPIQNTQNVTVNQQTVNKYNNYIADSTIPEPIMINRNGISKVDSFDTEEIKTYFQNYNSGEVVLKNENKNGLKSDVVLISLNNTDNLSGPDTQKQTNNTLNVDKTSEQEIVRNQLENTQSNNQLSKTDLEIWQVGKDQEVNFMVQIAASRIPLTKAQLWSIYPGNLAIEITREHNWYIYRIPGFRVFSEANRVALESGVESAYVVSEYNKKEISLPEARHMTDNYEKALRKQDFSSIPGLVSYFIQITASRTQLTGGERDMVFNTYPACREILESGWFKYQILAGASYSDALSLKRSLPETTFIVAYKNGTRISLHK